MYFLGVGKKKTIRLFANSKSFAYLYTQKQETTVNMATTRNIAGKKIANEMTSSLLIHPGEMIKDEIIARGITQKELAQQMGVSYTVFNEILNGKRPVTTEYALLLEAALGTSASIWIGLQAVVPARASISSRTRCATADALSSMQPSVSFRHSSSCGNHSV